MKKVKSSSIKKISQVEAENLFLDYKKISASGVAFSNVTYFTDESKSKTKGGKKMLQKLVSLNATIGSDYAKKVNRILKNKQGQDIDFVAQPMKGKEYVNDGQPVVRATKDGNLQLVFIVENHTTPNSQLYKDGQPVNRKDVWNSDFITPAGLKPNTTSGRGLIREENDFKFRTVKFSNLRNFKIGGTLYIIEN